MMSFTKLKELNIMSFLKDINNYRIIIRINKFILLERLKFLIKTTPVPGRCSSCPTSALHVLWRTTNSLSHLSAPKNTWWVQACNAYDESCNSVVK